jgi:AcrR family transcriptional regulator
MGPVSPNRRVPWPSTVGKTTSRYSSTEARSRIVKAAVECFAAKGYAGTKVADIERAAGLSVGAGGTYRHFESKRAILEAVIDLVLDVPDEEIAPPGDDVEAIAHEMLDYMRSDLLRIYFRDLDEFPDQRRRINERTIKTSYRAVSDRVAAANPTIDADAAAAVLLGSLINFRINEALIGPDANGVDRDRFIETWGAIYRSLLDDRPTPR